MGQADDGVEELILTRRIDMSTFMVGLWWAVKIGLFLFFLFSHVQLSPVLVPVALVIGAIWGVGWLVKKNRDINP